ncbi:hypothetical protein PLESTB_001136900 [Pleodorina starrii]|uniref:Uncharacterized protein n=1 Tax=Pleodorina starrii TaxID=330485 RepID=A0A9W6BRR4_9CHLO|nr:hypothetical protein PLESTB_001136900 [Pleodorina starrii]
MWTMRPPHRRAPSCSAWQLPASAAHSAGALLPVHAAVPGGDANAAAPAAAAAVGAAPFADSHVHARDTAGSAGDGAEEPPLVAAALQGGGALAPTPADAQLPGGGTDALSTLIYRGGMVAVQARGAHLLHALSMSRRCGCRTVGRRCRLSPPFTPTLLCGRRRTPCAWRR